MRRRRFISFVAAAGLLPGSALAQQTPRPRRLGVLLGQSESTASARLRYTAFKERLAALGWPEGQKLQIDVRWTGGDAAQSTAFAKELVALQPDVIASTTTLATTSVQAATRTIPVVFMAVSDPIGSGLVKTLAQPGGNVTGFVDLEPSLIEKSLELLTEIAPRVSRVAIMFNPDTASYANVYLRHMKSAAPRTRVTTFTAEVRSESDIDRALNALSREPGGGLIVMPDSFMGVHYQQTVVLAARYKVPATYFAAPWVLSGGLSAYGPDVLDLRRRAAEYVDRILRGAKPAELPVQQPTKFELYVNANTARALGLTIPQSVLVRADKVVT